MFGDPVGCVLVEEPNNGRLILDVVPMVDEGKRLGVGVFGCGSVR